MWSFYLLFVITILYVLGAAFTIMQDPSKWPEAFMLFGPVIINVGLLYRLA